MVKVKTIKEPTKIIKKMKVKMILKPGRMIVKIKEHEPAEYEPIYFDEELKEAKRNMFFS